MPIIKRAIKKLRHDRKITLKKAKMRESLRTAVKNTRKVKSEKNLKIAFSALDKAAKLHIIHPNKAARLKSRLSKTIAAKA